MMFMQFAHTTHTYAAATSFMPGLAPHNVRATLCPLHAIHSQLPQVLKMRKVPLWPFTRTSFPSSSRPATRVRLHRLISPYPLPIPLYADMVQRRSTQRCLPPRPSVSAALPPSMPPQPLLDMNVLNAAFVYGQRAPTPPIEDVEMMDVEPSTAFVLTSGTDADVEMRDAWIEDVEMEDVDAAPASVDEITAGLAALSLADEVDYITDGLRALSLHDEVDDLASLMQSLSLGPGTPVPSASTFTPMPAMMELDVLPDADMDTTADDGIGSLTQSTAMMNLAELARDYDGLPPTPIASDTSSIVVRTGEVLGLSMPDHAHRVPLPTSDASPMEESAAAHGLPMSTLAYVPLQPSGESISMDRTECVLGSPAGVLAQLPLPIIDDEDLSSEASTQVAYGDDDVLPPSPSPCEDMDWDGSTPAGTPEPEDDIRFEDDEGMNGLSRPVVGDDNPFYDGDPEDYDDEVLLEGEDMRLFWEQEEEEHLNEMEDEAALHANGTGSPTPLLGVRKRSESNEESDSSSPRASRTPCMPGLELDLSTRKRVRFTV